MKERELQRQVTDAASRLGWRYHHEATSFGSKPGWPDLAMFHPEHGAIYVELKVGRRPVTKAQADWLRWLKASGQTVLVVRDCEADLDVLYGLMAGDGTIFDGVRQMRDVYGLEAPDATH